MIILFTIFCPNAHPVVGRPYSCPDKAIGAWWFERQCERFVSQCLTDAGFPRLECNICHARITDGNYTVGAQEMKAKTIEDAYRDLDNFGKRVNPVKI
jgi:hypothetical protein